MARNEGVTRFPVASLVGSAHNRGVNSSEPARRAVFLSYASQDTPAAAAIAATLRAEGIEVWFDQAELRGGEAWDAKIKRQIRECALFVPMVSTNTQARPEGYFRLEWHLAEQRSLLIARGRPFLLPVCLDETKEGDALVPDAFLAVQWTRLPGGAVAPAFVAQVKRLLAGGAIPAASGSSSVRGDGSQPARMRADAPAIPDYELLRQIGRGAYGDVWLARGLTGAYRAVKIVWRGRFDDAAPYDREFRGVKEAMALSQEPGLLPLLHVGRDEAAGYFYYVMELADDAKTGRVIDPAAYVPLTLKELKARHGRLPAARCLEFAEDLARALASLHARELVHRDIKPSNVVIVHGRPMLADIGLLAAAGDAHTFVGTKGYLAPEGPGSPVADVFALGRLLYEIATGFDREEFPRLPADITDRAERTTLFELNEILLRAGEPLAQNRYPDATAMLADLRARRTQPQGSKSSRPRRRPGWVWAMIAVVVLAGGSLLWSALRRPGPLQVNDRAIAVLPFANLSGDSETTYFADGIHEDILTDLTTLTLEGELRIVSRTSVMQYRDPRPSLREIAERLNVAHILEGSVRSRGGQVRVSVQLIDARTDGQVWAKTYTGDLSDPFAIQSKLASEIAAELKARMP